MHTFDIKKFHRPEQDKIELVWHVATICASCAKVETEINVFLPA